MDIIYSIQAKTRMEEVWLNKELVQVCLIWELASAQHVIYAGADPLYDNGISTLKSHYKYCFQTDI